jgi:hypothetical protein
MTPNPHAAERFLELFASGETDEASRLFAHVMDIDLPLCGRVSGDRAPAALRDAAAAARRGGARLLPVHTTFGDKLVVAEGVLKSDVDVPVAVVAEHSEAGALVAVRLYHGTLALTGRRLARPPLLLPDERQPLEERLRHELERAYGTPEIKHCSVIDDGSACAVEFEVQRGREAHAGLAVQEGGETRIYDDMDARR